MLLRGNKATYISDLNADLNLLNLLNTGDYLEKDRKNIYGSKKEKNGMYGRGSKIEKEKNGRWKRWY